MKKYFKSLLFSSFVLSISIINADGVYREELRVLKELKEEGLILDKDVDPSIRNLANDINNHSQLSAFSRFMRSTALRYGVIVTKDSMPQLYNYIQTICDNNNFAVPTILISKDEDLLNAFAQKLYATSGVIIIGQRIIEEYDDETVEAVVAHELGHIKGNHVNKIRLANLTVLAALFYLIIKKYPLKKIEKSALPSP
mgnify:CR=1 FL=1